MTALVAFVRRFPRVDPIVCDEIALPTKTLATSLAGEWLFASVDSIVYSDMTLLCKTLAAYFALEWLFASVVAIVSDEIALACKTFSTHIACMRSLAFAACAFRGRLGSHTAGV